MSAHIDDAPTLLSWLRSELGRWRLGLLLAICRSLVLAPLPWLLGLIIDRHVPANSVSGIGMTALVFIGLLLLHFCFSVAAARLIGKTITNLVAEMRSRIFNRMQFLSFGYLDQSTTGRLLSKYAFDTQKVQDITINILNQIIPSLFYGLGVLVVMMFLNWQLSVLIMLVLPIFQLARSIFHDRLKDRNHHARLAQETLTGSANEMISALRLVRSLGEENKAESRLTEDNQRVADTRIGVISLASVFGTFIFVSNQAISLFVVAVGGVMVLHDMLTIGELFAFLAALPILMQPFGIISQFIEQYIVGQESYISIRELLTCKYVESWNGTRILSPMRGTVEFDQVEFAYPSKPDTAVLSDFHLRIQPGENVALVGASGSGKSTIASLILGLYQIQKGQIRIDGTPQDMLNMQHFRQRCAIVMQDNILLSGTILDNIRFARDSASDEEVRAAARAANAEGFIHELPEGYNSVIGERGVSLSGGQKQRISIARAILRDPQILILDEATSALDNESEALIQDALQKLAKGRTVITIAHRLSTIRNADRIIVMGRGKIVEQGTFDDLARQGGAFTKLLDSAVKSTDSLAIDEHEASPKAG